ncbi:hypothetical protein COU57_06330 [Candidatus Pacearchaeota archaeon CG10_big_fil_rev_8_21_14_0_10_32_14]|nr:MAG: hypothetical protein COU57_06330 [Candidatus Pacearchaeota archaeon CG10_big_fil_rev_8_21_14_0_10_32_14]
MNSIKEKMKSSKTIMIVDDEEDIRNTVKEILLKNGFKVNTALNADDCLKKIKTKSSTPDLILMDIMMPGTPVRDIIPKLSPLKVAYLSVVKTTEAEKEKLTKEKNVVGFIQKPFDVDDLISKIKKIMKA